MKKIFITLLLICCCACLAQDKQWNSGTLLSYDQQTFTTYAQSKGTGHEVPHTTYRVQIDAGDRIYFAERTLNFAWQKFPKVTENGPISWRSKNDNELLIRDDKGTEFTLTIIKTRLKSENKSGN